MANQRKIEIFTAGCPVCDHTVEMVRSITCDSCDVEVLNLSEEKVARRAEELGIRFVPAVAINGKLASCCTAGGVSEDALRAEGVGQPL